MQISPRVALAFVGALVASLVTIAYLVGRDHGRRRTEPVAVVSAPTPVAQLAPPPAAMPVPVAEVPRPLPAAESMPVPRAPAVAQPVAEMPAQPVAAGEPGDGAAVQAYFMRMDALGGGSLLGDNAQDVAEKLLASAVGGDSSGFDAMVKVASNAASAARATSVPAACQHFHGELLTMLDQSTQMLTSLTAAIKHNDTGALTGIAMGATSLQSRATALQAEEKAIKTRYGLK